MADEKKLSLKERLAQKNALKKAGGGAKTSISKADFEKKQEEKRILEEQRLKELERKRKEAERVRLEAEAKAAEEAARKKAEEEAEYLKQKRDLEIKEKEEAIKAISGETNAGDPGRNKSDYIILVAIVILAAGITFSMGRTFLDRKAKNDTVKMAQKALPVFMKADAVLEEYDKYFRNHKDERIDFGAGKILGKKGERFLVDDEFMKLPTYAASFYGYGTMVGKNTLKYVQLYSSIVRASIRLNGFLSGKNGAKVIKILKEVNEQKSVIKITEKTRMVIFNSDYPLPQNKEYILKMGTLVEYLGPYTPTPEEKRAEMKRRKHMRIRYIEKLRIRLLDDPAKLGELIVPLPYFTPVNNPYKFFQTLKPEYVKYQEIYNSIKADWKEISAIRENIKKDLKKKSNDQILGMAF